MWTFSIVFRNIRPTLEQLKRALDENRVIFNASDYNKNIAMFVTNQVHGTPRRARASTSRRATGTTRSRRVRNAPADPAVAEAELQRAAAAEAERQRAENVARIEEELAAARENVAQLERQLAAARVGGGKRRHKK